MTGYRSFLVTFLAIGLSACVLSGGTAIGPTYGPGCTPNAAKQIKNVDWAEARVLTIRIRQDEFEPMIISMRQDSPYIFRIENRDDYEHFFMASTFFRSVAIASIRTPEKISGASCINGVRIGPLETVELRLVAIRDGRYEYMDKMFPVPSLGSMTGIISIDLPLKYVASLLESMKNKKPALGSALQDGGGGVAPAPSQPSDINPFDATEPIKPLSPDASPFETTESAKPLSPDASPFETIEPIKPLSPDASPFETTEPAKPLSPDASPFETTEPAPKNLNTFDTAKPEKASAPPSSPAPALPTGSVPDPFDSAKPVLHNIRIPDPFPDIGSMSGSKTSLVAPVVSPGREKSDTLGTASPTPVITVIGSDTPMVPPPPSGNTSAKPKPGIKAKIRARIKGFLGSLFGN